MSKKETKYEWKALWSPPIRVTAEQAKLIQKDIDYEKRMRDDINSQIYNRTGRA